MKYYKGMIATTILFASCAGSPSEPDAPVPVADQPAPEPTTTAAPSEPKQTQTVAAADEPKCPPLIDEAAFGTWREQLMSGVNTNDFAAAKRAIQCAQPAFAAELFEQSEEWAVDASPRHLDADSEEEWVLQFRQHSPVIGHGERHELVWLAIFDLQDGAYQAAGVVVRPKQLACVLADDEGIKVEFGDDVPGDEAGMVLTEQSVRACGTLVDVAYTKTIHKVESGKLVSLPLKAPKTKSYSRTEGATDE